ncbi:MAG TPA: hypothetical protein ENK44_16690 [Caldithrix abyssi]|uniref:RagB/SusD family nutrient uptake outer membrane protein n=1 Tax=Caldithrix abyssi TaxID=187145 RepID=A0A7V4WWW6_CALAY|nr:hypothetical protein [Caldithrix abyssi]
MKKNIVFIIVMAILALLTSCDNYVQDVDPLIDRVEDDRLNSPDQLDFLIKGVKHRFSTMYDNLVFLAGGLSDELYYDANAPGSSFPTLREIDLAEDIRRDNNSVDGVFTPLGELRFFADNLVTRATSIGTGEDLEGALFTGYFFGGLARFFYATYFGLYQEQGGGVIDGGPFIPSSDMYDLAIEKFTEALNHTDYEGFANWPDITSKEMAERLTHSMIARCYLYKGDAASALTHAEMGMQEGDDPFMSLYSAITNNVWYYQANERHQYLVDDRFADYITADPNEANRVKIYKVESGSLSWWQQAFYLTLDAPINCMTWQENELMLAELKLTSDNAAALAHVNKVRASHGLDPLTTLDEAALIAERDKELMTTGARLPDQRRFDIWHLPAGTWKYLPITQSEINGNPNLDVGPE